MAGIHWIDAVTPWSIPMKKPTPNSFGARLAAARMARGVTQEELGDLAGSSQRMIAHYENSPGAQPPADVLAALAQALDVSADELLGLKAPAEQVSPATYRLRRRLRKIEQLPPDDQKTIVRLVDAIVTSRAVKDED